MAEPDDPLLAPLREHVAQLAGQLGQMVRLRAKLAELELQAALRCCRRLVVGMAAGGTLVLAGLPVLLVTAAQLLDGRLHVPAWGWLLGMGAALVFGGVALCWSSWRRFRRQFVGFEETLEELREDIRWLREWTGRED